MADTVQDLLGPEETVDNLLGAEPAPFAQEAPIPRDALERASADYLSNQQFQKETGVPISANQGTPADFDKPLLKIVPELSDEDLETLRQASPGEQGMAAAANTVAKSVNSLTSQNNLSLLAATMGLGAAPALGRAVALGFAAYMGKNAVDAARQLSDEFQKSEAERDPQKIGALMAQGGVNGFLATVGAIGGLKGEPAPAGEKVAGRLSREVGRADLGDVEPAAIRGGQPTVEKLLGPEPVQTSEPRLEKPTVPETPAEPYQTGVEEIRAKGARTTRQIQQLWPKAELSREEARVWRDRAWPSAIKESGTPLAAVELPAEQVGESAPAAPAPQLESAAPGETPQPTAPAPAAPQEDVPDVATPVGEVESTTILHPREAGVVELPVSKIKLSKDVPNFKAESAPETGVVKGQELQGKYERLGTPPVVVWRRLNGDLEVITGRHRLDLARRSGEERIPSQIVEESRGFTRAMALTFDAEANIRDGQGSIEDYAHYFHNSPQLTEEAARSRGLLSRAKGEAGWDLGRNASDDLRALWAAGKISEAQAVAIAHAAPADPALQRVGTSAAVGGARPEILSNLIAAARLETGGRTEQLDLLGADDSAMQRMQAMAKRAASAQRTIAEQIRAVQGAAKRPELARKMGVDVGDPQGVLNRIEALRGEQARWENWPLHQDLVDQVRGEEFTLAKAESVEEQRARTEAEEAARQTASQKENILSESAAPLKGTTGDVGQGDLLGGGDLFSPPSPVTHSMAAGGAPGLRGPSRPSAPAPQPLPPAPTRLVGAAPSRPILGPLRSRLAAMRVGLQSIVSPQNIDSGAKAFSHILRENNAQAALDLVRADQHLGELRSFFDKTPVPKDWAYDPNQPLPFNYAVMDALERNRAALPQELQAFAKAFDDEFAWRIAEVRKLKPGALSQLIQNYFPHLWEKPDSPNTAAIMKEVAAKAPFHGSQAFMKERSVPLFLEGVIRGLKPLSDNPVDLLLAKMHQMDKFLAAAKTMQEAKANGMLRYYPLGRKIPGDRVVADDPAFTVFAPPFLEVREAFDAGVRRGLVDFMNKMGFSHERTAKLGVNTWGQYEVGGKIKSRFGGPDFVIMHEIGHGLEERYGLSNYLLSNDTLRSEMNKLAELRAQYGGSKKFRKYIQTSDEQVANAVHAYIYAPELMQKVAPTAQMVMRNIIRAHPELEDLNEIKPGVSLKSETAELPLPGPVLAGHWTLPTGPAAVLSNYLSPGLNRWSAFRTLRAASNIINAAQLGLSGFHVGFTSLDAMVSSTATGLGYLIRGEPAKAAKSLAFAPVSPVANYYVGKAVQAKMIDPNVTHVPIGFPKIGLGANVRLSPAADLLTRQIAELAVKGGLRAETDPFWKTNLTRNLVRAWHQGGVLNYGKAALQVPLALVEQSMRPIAEYLVPRQKLGVFAQLALQEMDRIGWNAKPEQVRGAMARAADWTEDRMGQMTYDNLFYNKMVKDAALLGFRAYGWQLGKYRHLYGMGADTASLVKGLVENGVAAAKGAPSPNRVEITNRMLYPLALTMVVGAAGAIMHRLFTGTNPQELKDYFFPRTGRQDLSGREERLALPSYAKDLAADGRALQSSWMERSPGPAASQFAHRLNSYLGTAADMWSNKDYYGVEIRHPDDPLSKQMAELTQFALKQFTPFSISGTAKLAEEKAPLAQLVLPFIGIVPAKKALLMTPAETLAADITMASTAIGGRTREQFDHSKLLKTIVQDIRRNGTTGQALDQAVVAGKLRPGDEQALTSMLNTTPLEYQVSKMSPADAMRVWRVGSAAERQQLQQRIAQKVAVSRVLESGKRTAYLQELFKPVTPAPNAAPLANSSK